MSSNTVIAALEQKYIELLEEKIARLESVEGNTQFKASSLVGYNLQLWTGRWLIFLG